jgi:hypothetical protein
MSGILEAAKRPEFRNRFAFFAFCADKKYFDQRFSAIKQILPQTNFQITRLKFL